MSDDTVGHPRALLPTAYASAVEVEGQVRLRLGAQAATVGAAGRPNLVVAGIYSLGNEPDERPVLRFVMNAESAEALGRELQKLARKLRRGGP